MMFDSDILLSVFRRKGGSGKFTREFDAATDHLLVASQDLLADERPLIWLARTGGECGYLLTNYRLLPQLKSDASIELSRLVGIRPPMSLELKKIGWETLTLHLRGNEPVTIQLEPGPPFFAVWSTLLFVASRNNRAPVQS